MTIEDYLKELDQTKLNRYANIKTKANFSNSKYLTN
jgi:hypothetical protein